MKSFRIKRLLSPGFLSAELLSPKPTKTFLKNLKILSILLLLVRLSGQIILNLIILFKWTMKEKIAWLGAMLALCFFLWSKALLSGLFPEYRGSLYLFPWLFKRKDTHILGNRLKSAQKSLVFSATSSVNIYEKGFTSFIISFSWCSAFYLGFENSRLAGD